MYCLQFQLWIFTCLCLCDPICVCACIRVRFHAHTYEYMRVSAAYKHRGTGAGMIVWIHAYCYEFIVFAFTPYDMSLLILFTSYSWLSFTSGSCRSGYKGTMETKIAKEISVWILQRWSHRIILVISSTQGNYSWPFFYVIFLTINIIITRHCNRYYYHHGRALRRFSQSSRTRKI